MLVCSLFGGSNPFRNKHPCTLCIEVLVQIPRRTPIPNQRRPADGSSNHHGPSKRDRRNTQADPAYCPRQHNQLPAVPDFQQRLWREAGAELERGDVPLPERGEILFKLIGIRVGT